MVWSIVLDTRLSTRLSSHSTLCTPPPFPPNVRVTSPGHRPASFRTPPRCCRRPRHRAVVLHMPDCPCGHGQSLEWRSAPGRNGHFNHRPGAGLPVGTGPLALAGPSALGRRNAVHEPQRRAELRLPPGRARPANSRAASHGPLPRFQSKSRPGPGPAASRTGLPSRTIDAARTVTVHLTRTDSDRC